MSDRKRTARRALRLPVKFWRLGEKTDAHSGYTMNVSEGGIFVATYRPLPPNTFIEIEVEHPDRVVRTIARVVHAAKYPAQFQSVMKSGMGLRFHSPEDPAVSHLAAQGQLLPDRGGRRRFTRL